MQFEIAQPITNAVERVNAFQDHLVRTYFQPNAVSLLYWSFAFVFLYVGLQKVAPHRSSADAQLATVGGLIGIPYMEFVTLIGIWQILIGLFFLLRRLRLAAMLFVTFQIFTFGTLVVLNQIVFQPPWFTVLGVDIPWALGAYAAFILKNLVLAGAFFVLASVDAEPITRPSGGASG